MADAGIDGELDVCPCGFGGVDDGLSGGELDHAISVAVKRPDGHPLERRSLVRFAAATDGDEASEAFGVLAAPAPGAEAAQAESGQDDALLVDAVVGENLVEELIERADVPAGVGWALRGNHYVRNGTALFERLREAILADELDVGAAFARAVEEDHQRPLLRLILIIVGW